MAQQFQQTDCLIAGAGPVGLTLACELTRYGLGVRIIDSAPEPTDQSRALVVWPRTMEHLERMGLAQRFVQTGRKAHEGHFFQGGEQIATFPLDNVATPFPFALMIPQDQTERLLTERLRELGVEVERGKTLTTLTHTADSVTAIFGGETLTVPWLIGTDGAHSAVRHAVGAEFDGTTLPSDWVLGDVHLSGPVAVSTVELHLHQDGILAMFPVGDGRTRVIANVHTGPADPTLGEIQAILDRRDGRGLRADDPVWLSGFHINERKVAEYRHGRVFLAGDAAHIHSPAGGQGMNTGMQDAVNLAWKLALVQHNSVSRTGGEALLNSYTPERGPVAAKVLEGSGFLTRVGTTTSSLLQTVRKHALHLLSGFEAVQQAFAEQVTELAVAYPGSPLNGKQGSVDGPKPGERAPIKPGEAPVSDGSEPRFALYATRNENTEQLIACFPGLIEPEPREPFAEGGLWLVRPDGYVAFTGESDEPGFVAADAWFRALVYELA
jgi:2-polyprenyl-6-methoxyphenol hydroxylase-like FAD-dependent oxidoreductase